jgi:hypothetical protein
MTNTEPPWTDDQWIIAIDAENNPCRLAVLVLQFYRDRTRAERQPPALLFLHIAFLCRMIQRLVQAQRQQSPT